MNMLNENNQMQITHAFCCVASLQEQAARSACSVEEEKCRPFMLLRPRIFPDGNQWCALYGDNLQDGVAGFGDTPAKASYDFDNNWHNQRLMQQEKQ